jgi:hypothetical protein
MTVICFLGARGPMLFFFFLLLFAFVSLLRDGNRLIRQQKQLENSTPVYQLADLDPQIGSLFCCVLSRMYCAPPF